MVALALEGNLRVSYLIRLAFQAGKRNVFGAAGALLNEIEAQERTLLLQYTIVNVKGQDAQKSLDYLPKDVALTRFKPPVGFQTTLKVRGNR